jgi:hypothetical protein
VREWHGEWRCPVDERFKVGHGRQPWPEKERPNEPWAWGCAEPVGEGPCGGIHVARARDPFSRRAFASLGSTGKHRPYQECATS